MGCGGPGHNPLMRISARADYAVRAALGLARADQAQLRSSENLAAEQSIPANFLEGILTALRRAGIVESRRGAGGGYRLARAASEISVADVIRAVEGPLVFVRDSRPTALEYPAESGDLLALWVALRAGVRRVLDDTSLQNVIDGTFPASVAEMLDAPDAWDDRPGDN